MHRQRGSTAKKNTDLYFNENFSIRAVPTWKAGTRELLGYQLKIINVTQGCLLIGQIYSFPGIFAEALSGDPIFPTADRALAVWGNARYPVSDYMEAIKNATATSYYAKPGKAKK